MKEGPLRTSDQEAQQGGGRVWANLKKHELTYRENPPWVCKHQKVGGDEGEDDLTAHESGYNNEQRE